MIAADKLRADRALAALCVDPAGLKGMVIRARPGPVRQAWDEALSRLALPLRRIHPGLDDTQLFGGLNVAASIASGHMIRDAGLAESAAVIVLPMAERTPPGLAARLGQLLDADTGHALILLDEGAEPEEMSPPALAERLAFHLDLSGFRAADAQPSLPASADIDRAQANLHSVVVLPEAVYTLTVTAARLGIASLRAPLLALRCARALVALEGDDIVTDEHLREAAELVYPCRATQIPEEPQEPPEDTPERQNGDQTEGDGNNSLPPEDMLIKSVAACLPDGLLAARDKARTLRGAKGSGAGQRRKGNRRGRPLPPRPGRPDGRARIDVFATLRAAAPWQALRRKSRETDQKLIIHPSDIRLRRYEDRSDRLVIFAVDASGSAAMARMAEAKGAVEILLAEAYAQRDQVALVAFRKEGAELLLPPTRALVQAKRRLQALPGGGGTPLAAGIRAAIDIALHARRGGLAPTLAVLTDGRANIALDGGASRARAREDTNAMAVAWHQLGLPGLVIDTSPRAGPDSAALAEWLGARHLALPRADSRRISTAAKSALAS
ncbi:magnesium chelatase subunit D [Lutimaribacter marinistellae]|uniref:Magnesium chelatase subunit D n=1 Tax=Lutimaribacter marinistellae TaxID=1820329 RepID=A0ABV7TF74_9RHOB